ncbi:ABC transporter substrate-binding protein [Gordonia sp. ABSL1-1]|uniref:ABC transporter substrate-binding protein n=1 Tax=Gordonia sp. ABSL1-1 TaxID=3053923 RepID=UPI0025739F64|nr:ABC transporter substrate-binding protein [Gordonia sp. ABSL1-1]MDL9938082.1 ABC transporter substrate-binding protein [Gordonia sp. ABSL1-1]
MNPLRGLRPARVLAASLLITATTILGACSSTDDEATSADVSAPPGSFPGIAATGAPIKIGLINNEGGQAISEPDNRLAAEAAAEYANAELGGIGGHKIELVVCKNAEEPASARDCANQMVEKKVSAVVVTTTGLGDILVPTITGAGIPYISTAGQSTQELTSDKSFLWSGGFPSSLQAMATHAKNKGMKNVTAFTIDVPAAVNGLRMIGVPAFKAAGVDLKVVPIPPGTADSTPQVSAGLTGDPEGVVIVGEGTLCTTALKSLGTLAYSGEKMGIQACTSPDIVKAVGPSIEGMTVFTAALTNGDDDEARLYRAVIAKYRPAVDTAGYAYVGYQGVLGLVRATKTLTDTSPAGVMTAIRASKDVILPAGGGLTFTCNGTANPMMKAVCGKGSIMATLTDGELTNAELVNR